MKWQINILKKYPKGTDTPKGNVPNGQEERKMKMLKRNQIIVLVIALMLVSAGYLNYTANTESNTVATSSQEEIQYAGIGDAKLVSSNGIV